MKMLRIEPVVAIPFLLALSGPVPADDSLLRAELDRFGKVPPSSPQESGNFKRASIRTKPSRTPCNTHNWRRQALSSSPIFTSAKNVTWGASSSSCVPMCRREPEFPYRLVRKCVLL